MHQFTVSLHSKPRTQEYAHKLKDFRHSEEGSLYTWHHPPTPPPTTTKRGVSNSQSYTHFQLLVAVALTVRTLKESFVKSSAIAPKKKSLLIPLTTKMEI